MEINEILEALRYKDDDIKSFPLRLTQEEQDILVQYIDSLKERIEANKMKEVFLVIDEWVVGGDESCDEMITCYNSYEDAKKDYDERVRSAKIDAEEWGCDELEEGKTEDKDYFFTYRDGEYANYHISVSLIRKEVY